MSAHQQLLYHVVFSTLNRQRWLTDGFREKVFGYLAGTAQNLGCYPIIVGGYYDHVHLLLRIPAKIAISDFMRELKCNTSKHINDTSNRIEKFGWQQGYGAFTVSYSQKDIVYAYIQNQMNHHSNQSFESEYLELLKKNEIIFDSRYLWE